MAAVESKCWLAEEEEKFPLLYQVTHVEEKCDIPSLALGQDILMKKE